MTTPGDGPGRGELTAEERGDTIPRGRRWLVRLVVAVIVVGGLGATVLVTNGVPDRLQAFFAPGQPTGTALPGTAAPTAASAAAASATPTAAPPAISGDAELLARLQEVEDELRPSSTLAPYPLDEADLEQSRLVQVHDLRWALIARGGVLDAASAATTLVLPPRAAAYSLGDLVALGAVERLGETDLLLSKTVFVLRGAALRLDAAGQTLHLASGRGGFAPVVVWGGRLELAGAEGAPLTITSRDPETGTADLEVSDGRAYLRVHEGALAADHVVVGDLGFWSGRTGGVAVTGTSTVAATAAIRDSEIVSDHIGLYLDAVQDVTVERTAIRGSTAQGVEVGSGTSGVVLRETTVTASGETGVSVRPGSFRVTVADSSLTRNGGWGLRFDGSPRASGPNPSGYGVENSWGLAVTGSTVTANRSGGVWIRSTSDVDVSGTEIEEAGSGMVLTDSQAAVVDNRVVVDAGNGIVFDGPLTSARVQGNTISGEGPSAVAVRGGANVVGAANDDSGWTERWEALLWIEAHPLALLWGLLLVIPLVGVAFVFHRMRRQRRIRELVEASTIALARAERERYAAARAMGEVGPVAADSATPDTATPDITRAGAASVDSATPGTATPDTATPVGRPIRTPAARPDPTSPPESTARELGRFATREELAVTAVLDAGKPIDRVAHALRVPVGTVAGWVARARRVRAEAEADGTRR